jgi:tRNA threonylcarbamoyladenosine biosynthesis protein TsaE
MAIPASTHTRRWSALDEGGLLALGERLGAVAQGGEVLLLRGGMGAGKTTLVRALARGLAVTRPDRVSSPTYNICVEHPGPYPLVHVDLCRLGELGELDAGARASAAAFEALGLDELAVRLARSGAREVLAIEWSELWSDAPADALHASIERVAGDASRALELRAGGTRAIAWLDALGEPG